MFEFKDNMHIPLSFLTKYEPNYKKLSLDSLSLSSLIFLCSKVEKFVTIST